MGIEYLVAPYEADAQLAFLEKRGIVDFIITEDSDMLAFGCKKVVFKLDDTGNGILFDRENLKLVKTISLATFTNESFRHMCILSGCDYLDSVHNVALKKAHKYLLQNKQISKVVHLMRCDGLNVPPDYLRMFDIADKTFLHQKVFDPIEKRLRHLEDLSENVDSEILKYFGDLDDDEIAHYIAIGEIDPSTHRPFADSSCLENSTPKDNLLSRWIRPKPALKGHSSEPIRKNPIFFHIYLTSNRHLYSTHILPIVHKSHGDHSKTTDKPPTPSYITPTNRTTTICTSSFRSFSRSPSVTSSASSTTSSVTTTPTSNTISSFFSSSTSTSTSKSMSLFPANIPLGPKRLFSSTSLTESRAGLLTSDFQVKRRKSSIEPDTNRTEKLSRFFSSSILHTPSIKLSSTSKPINGSRSSSINLSPTESIKISSILKHTKKP
ncbi:Exonuclease 1 [Zancudomyces culisetae]|uniref:Exonuclease 1 n=1 Tax=Zancudomyces culisetae TaxID=1213189 RepID=A0A1R1PBW3_ZANCU|nr:Exonuclease 1 [Zancudomyces culisetae]|eukprot:OMH78454.1 Exonuclease 1 [Zancudomyces culisetae]